MKTTLFFRKLLPLVVTLLVLAACTSTLQDEPALELEELETQAATTFTKTVPNVRNDAEETTTSYYNNSTVLELGEKSPGAPQLTGVRFSDVAIPKGATVTSARIEFIAATSESGATSLTIHGIKEANAPEFTSSYSRLSDRPKTTADSSWTPNAWTTGGAYKTGGLANITQEIISQSGWNSGNALAYVITGTGLRKAVSYDNDSSKAAKLTITYEMSAPTPTIPTCLTSSSPIVPTDTTSLRLKGLSTNAQVKLTGKTITGAPSENPTAVRLEDNGSGLCVSGGKLKTDATDTSSWTNIFHEGRNFVSISGSKGAKIERAAGDTAGDALGITSVRWVNGQKTAPASDHAENWSLSHSYFRHTGDDIVDNDMRAAGTIDNVLDDWTYVGIACRGYEYGFKRVPGKMTVKNTLFAMKPQASGYDGATNTYGYPFKWDEQSQLDANGTKAEYRKACPLALNNVTIYMATKPSGPNSIFSSRGIDPVDYVTECTNVTFLYGGTGYPHKAQLDKLRAKFGANCFKIIEGSAAKMEWNTRRDKWFADHDQPGFEHIQAYRYNQPLKP